MPAGAPLYPEPRVRPSLAMITPTWLREHVLCSSQAEAILINVSSIDGLLIGNPYAGNRTRFRFLEDRSCNPRACGFGTEGKSLLGHRLESIANLLLVAHEGMEG